MIKKEFKNNLKSFIIWSSVLIVMFILVFAIYPFILTDETVESLDEMMKVFPPELLKTFNMDITSINTAYGWLKSEGFMFILLITGIYSSFLGINILLKEESDKTIEYLSFLPIKRCSILTKKIIVSLTYILGISLLIGVVNFIALTISGDFNRKEYLLLIISPIFPSIVLFSLNLLISTFLKSGKKSIGISLGIVFISYLLSMLSEVSEKVEGLKYLSVYTLADVRHIIEFTSISIPCIVISIILSIVFITFSYIRYNKKELV